MAARHAEAGDPESAEKTFKEALERGRSAARVHYNFGTLLLQRGRHGEALSHLQRAIRFGWKDANAYVNLGVALQDLGRNGKAAASYRRALALNPQDKRAKVNLGQPEGTPPSAPPQ